ncbi:flavin monoamine oxidase family protein [Streptomyces albidus (ex Kaewkla and Franco 2022)]|uniref:flavin monoamine oxidase family protein n=1 Tax=Streptomyces albidus (ex Kaewkla and Franco 2022) TaxID=722709 RepID=UPI0015EF1ADE|nr:FAD-dependent oxidoreductase [Streptomyces albidus (ex Kaewkla and Franco 2022)]
MGIDPGRAYGGSGGPERRRVLALGLTAAAAGGVAGSGRTGATARRAGRPGAVPEPVSFLRTSWSTDPYARGSYSFLAPSRLGVKARTLLAAAVDGRLHFAGEACSSEAPATAHGALESGRRAAKEIVRGSREGRHVVVIGAGFAGLGCARALADAGFEVTVLEARDRVGGRVRTRRIGGVPAETGASWIHGSKGNAMTRVLRQSGGRGLEFDYGSVTGRDADAVAELARHRRRLDDVENPDTTPVSAVLPRSPSAALRHAANIHYAQEYAADPDRLAVTAEREGRDLRGPDLLLPDGYDSLVAHVRGGLPVRTGAVVTAVRHSSAGVTVTLRNSPAVEADHAVVTVPIGVLKADTIAFEPSLPPVKRQAVDALGSGLLDKLWLEFPHVFWDRDADVIEFFDREAPGRWSWWVNGHKAFGAPVLLGFNGGRAAHALARVSDEALLASCGNALHSMRR